MVAAAMVFGTAARRASLRPRRCRGRAGELRPLHIGHALAAVHVQAGGAPVVRGQAAQWMRVGFESTSTRRHGARVPTMKVPKMCTGDVLAMEDPSKVAAASHKYGIAWGHGGGHGFGRAKVH